MTAENNQPFSLPEVRMYFIGVTSLLVVLILAVQIAQDRHLEQERIESTYTFLLYEQIELAEHMSNSLFLMVKTKQGDFFDYQRDQFITNTENLVWSQQEMQALTLFLDDEESFLEEQDEIIAANLATLLSESNQLVDDIEQYISDEQKLLKKYYDYTSTYQQYVSEAHTRAGNLSRHLSDKLAHHRMIFWWVVIGFLLFVVIVSKYLYRVMSKLLRREVELVELNQAKLIEENRIRARNNQIISEQADKLFTEKMKVQAILESTIDAIITVNTAAEIETINKGAEKMFGIVIENVIGKHIETLIPSLFATAEQNIPHVIKNNKNMVLGLNQQLQAIRYDGSSFPIELTVTEVEGIEPFIFTCIIRDITEAKEKSDKLRATMEALQLSQNQIAEEEEIARRVFHKITATNNKACPGVSVWSKPMRTLSGDLTLSAELPSGGTRVLLCDFTGHGLPAALGAIPLSEVYAAAVEKAFSLETLLLELNKKLHQLLPTDLFCCISAIDINAEKTHAKVWNAGLPELLMLNQAGFIKRRFKSTHVPLGILAIEADSIKCVDVALEEGDTFYMYSDGLTEAENEYGHMFGTQRFEDLLSKIKLGEKEGRLEYVKAEIENFIGNAPRTDDISLVEIKQ